jgi:hypothetical protein
MSALGQKQTFSETYAMSALPPKADIGHHHPCERLTRARAIGVIYIRACKALPSRLLLSLIAFAVTRMISRPSGQRAHSSILSRRAPFRLKRDLGRDHPENGDKHLSRGIRLVNRTPAEIMNSRWPASLPAGFSLSAFGVMPRRR